MLGKNFLKKLKFISLKFDYLEIHKILPIKNDKRKQKKIFIKKIVCSKLFMKFVFQNLNCKYFLAWKDIYLLFLGKTFIPCFNLQMKSFTLKDAKLGIMNHFNIQNVYLFQKLKICKVSFKTTNQSFLIGNSIKIFLHEYM